MQIFFSRRFCKKGASTHYFSLVKDIIRWIYGAFFLLTKTHSGLKESTTVSVKSALPTAQRFNSRPRCPEKNFCRIRFIKKILGEKSEIIRFNWCKCLLISKF